MITVAFDPLASDAQSAWWEQFPDAAAVLLLETGTETAASGEPYLTSTRHLRKRLQRLLAPAPEERTRIDFSRITRAIRYWPVYSEFESRWTVYQRTRELFPNDYRKRLRMRAPVFFKLHLDDPYPRVSVRRGLGRPPARFWGPLPSRRGAESLAGEVLDQFRIRRCPDVLHPDPSFPGCVYSEMKMCLAPCQCGCTDAQYRRELQRVSDFLASRGAQLRDQLLRERQEASERLDFEAAARAHKKIEKITPVLRRLPAHAQFVDQLNGALLLPGPAPRQTAFLVRQGGICAMERLEWPQSTPAAAEEAQSQRAAALRHLRERLACAPLLSRAERNEHLALLLRCWSAKKPEGEWLELIGA